MKKLFKSIWFYLSLAVLGILYFVFGKKKTTTSTTTVNTNTGTNTTPTTMPTKIDTTQVTPPTPMPVRVDYTPKFILNGKEVDEATYRMAMQINTNATGSTVMAGQGKG